MNKKTLVALLTALTLVSYQNLYAHNENHDSEKREAERKTAEKQEAREDWNDFMSAIKKQETKASADKESSAGNTSSQ